MGKRGPKPTPTTVLAQRGSWRAKTRQGEADAAPAALADIPAAPEWLSPGARAHWRGIIDPLVERGLLTPLDSMAAGMLCESFATFIEARAIVEAEGMVAQGSRGPVQHPAVRIRDAAFERFTRLSREFGMTPNGRAGLPLTPPKRGDLVDAKDKFFKQD